jgi:hypothetical protein
MKVLRHIAIIFLLFSCSKYTERASKEITPSAFREIRLDDSFEVFLREGASYSVEIEAAEAYVDEVTVRVEDSVLIVKNEAHGVWLHPKSNKVRLTITCPNLRLLTAFETCTIKTLNPITTSEFGLIVGSKVNMAEIEVNNQTTYCWNYRPCGGTLTFTGNTTTFKTWCAAILTVDASELNAQNAFIENSGKNDVLIAPSDYLSYSILGKGNIQLFQHPAVIDTVAATGQGKLIFH